MPIRIDIVPRRHLFVVTVRGHAGREEAFAAIDAVQQQPDFDPGLRHLIDLSQATSYERDFVGILKMQLRLNEVFARVPSELVISYYAPTRIAQEMAQTIRRSWDGLDLAVVRIFDTEEAALGFLGVPETRIEALLALSQPD